jgi:hypothetical protein
MELSGSECSAIYSKILFFILLLNSTFILDNQETFASSGDTESVFLI